MAIGRCPAGSAKTRSAILAVALAVASFAASLPSASARVSGHQNAASSPLVGLTSIAAAEPGLDCTPPGGTMSLALANEIRRGRLTLPPFPSARLPRDPTWRENPFRDVN